MGVIYITEIEESVANKSAKKSNRSSKYFAYLHKRRHDYNKCFKLCLRAINYYFP